MHLSYDRRTGRPTPRPMNHSDPIAAAIDMLGHRAHRQALVKAIEERVKTDVEERRFFGAAAGRVYGLSGQEAFNRALRNYLEDLRKPTANDRVSTLTFVAKVVAGIQGGQKDPTLDPRAAAEALFRKPA